MAGLKERTLTREQMAHLKELGIDTTNASVVLVFQDEDGNEVDWEDVNIRDGEPIYVDEDGDEWELSENYLDAETGMYDQSYRESCGVFTFEDIWDLLPEYIEEDGYTFNLNYYKSSDLIAYETDDECNLMFYLNFGPLVNAYKMLCWASEHGYLNKE